MTVTGQRKDVTVVPMTTAVVPRPRVTIAEYLAWDAEAPTKHILWDGEVFSLEATSGETLDHNTLCANVIVALGNALRGTRCRVVTSDQKVWVPHKQGFVYPDATVLCGVVARYPGTTDAVTNPAVIVEVLSERTEKFDRGDKFEGYRSIDSLRHCIMVSSRNVAVDHYVRAEGDTWLLHPYHAGDAFDLRDPDVSIAVDELYRMAFDEST
jgi:Uma2 family endonuclease